MFERFDPAARQVIVTAQLEARALRHGWVGTEHLLLGILGGGAHAGAGPFEDLGIDAAVVRGAIVADVGRGPEPSFSDADRDALGALGIDLDEVRRRVEATFGPGALDSVPPRRRRWRRRRCDPYRSGHVPFTPRSKRSLELALREALALRSREVQAGHLLLGILAVEDGMALRLLRARGVDCRSLRDKVRQSLGEAA